MPRETARRWLEGGWDTYAAAAAFYRRIWAEALKRGVRPGDVIGVGVHRHLGDKLLWLVAGHPGFASMATMGTSHFTIQPDGRGNHRFVLVDLRGVEHPFSTNAALTGVVKPLRQPVRCKRCGGLLEEAAHTEGPPQGFIHVFEPDIGEITS